MTPLQEEAYRKLVATSIEKPWNYNQCPQCEHLKDKRSKLCVFCNKKGRPPMEQPDNPSYRLIPLTRGKWAIVDAADYEWLMQWKWNAWLDPKSGSYYAKRGIYGPETKETVSMHRLILGLNKGEQKEGDHINGNTLDNRRSNLRVATRQQNAQNSKMKKTNKSGYKGVSWGARQKKFKATIMINGKNKVVCWSEDPITCSDAYEAASKKIFGKFARAI